MPLLDTSASLPPSTPSTSRGAARGARAGALSEGIRNSEIKCISLGNAPHGADQIKCIKVQGGESCLEPRGKKKLVQREEKRKQRREERRVEQSISSTAKLLFRIILSFGSHHHQKKKKNYKKREKSSTDNLSLGQPRPTGPQGPGVPLGRILSGTRSQAAASRTGAPLQLALTSSGPTLSPPPPASLPAPPPS